MRPRVAVTMADRNAQEMILSSLVSLQGRTMKAWELIGVDDARSDKPSRVVRALMKNDSRMKLANHNVVSRPVTGLCID